MAVQADISNSAEVNAAVKAALARFGKIEILINNAGRTAPPKMFVDKPEEEWDQDINIILRGPLIVTKAVLPQMIQRKFGHIVNICSGVGTFGMARGSIYAAAKGAVASFTRSLAKEVIKDGIWVNGVAPGLGDTNFLRSSQILKTQETPPEFLKAVTARIPLGRVTRPEDIGAVATFLCSAVASDIVGQIIDVDGGQIISQG